MSRLALNVQLGVAGVLHVAQRGHIRRGVEGQPHARTWGVCVAAKVVPLPGAGELSTSLVPALFRRLSMMHVQQGSPQSVV